MGLIDKIRERISSRTGDTETTQLEITTPVFDRPDHLDDPAGPPDADEFPLLREMKMAELQSAGMLPWDENGLMLFPYEWREHIPEGFEVVSISGRAAEYDPDDWIGKRHGALPCGIYAADSPGRNDRAEHDD